MLCVSAVNWLNYGAVLGMTVRYHCWLCVCVCVCRERTRGGEGEGSEVRRGEVRRERGRVYMRGRESGLG